MAIVGAAAAVLVWAPSAEAAIGHGSSSTTTTTTTGGSGAAQQTVVNSCSLYATSSSFGESCFTGGSGDGKSKTIGQVVGDDGVPQCWDDKISDDDLANIYQYQQNPAAPYYVETCIKPLSASDPVGTAVVIDHQNVFEIPATAQQCTVRNGKDKGKKQWSGPTQLGEDPRDICLEVLSTSQQSIVKPGNLQNADIPSIRTAVQPSQTIRVNHDYAYVDTALPDGSTDPKRTKDVNAGGVTMWATMNDDYRIFPAGPDGPSKACDGTESVGPNDSRADKPTACWWTYTESSNGQQGHTEANAFDFIASVSWTVHYQADGGDEHDLGTFTKTTEFDNPVLDVQSIVVH